MNKLPFEEKITQSNLESVDEGDLRLEIDKYQVELAELLFERNFDELNVKERSQALKLMKRMELLQQKQLIEKKEREQYWTREMFIDWAMTEVQPEWGRDWAEQYVDANFDLDDITSPKLLMTLMQRENEKNTKTIPPGLIGERINLNGTNARELPANLRFKYVEINNTPIKEIPSGFNCKTLSMEGCNLESVGSNLNIDKLVLTKGNFSDAIAQKLKKLRKQGNIKSIDVYYRGTMTVVHSI